MTLQAAAQGLVDRIADLGASPLDWSEYTALEKALEAAQAVEPVAWLVLDEDRVPIMCAPAEQMCNDHINDAINDFDITEASKWVVREAFTHPAPLPYDQQALELCDKCGWKAIIPGEPCFACNMQVAAPAWTLTADKMPEPCMNVMAYTGKGQPIRAQWVPAKTLEDNGDGDFGEYDEATDMYYWPEAWYETNAHEETHWMVDGHVTHWMPLPLPPQGGKP